MAIMKYGQTWWGSEWLKALSQLDYDNRLPRGRAYANKGAVKDLKVSGGQIAAKVKGSRPQPYQIKIDVPQWSAQDKTRLLDKIAADPSLIARLMNRDLDPAVLDLAKQLGIAVFPSQWKDLPMQCSCPDWAVPCKHLAATINMLSREIDGNPFLVFSLRGLNLADELKKRNIEIKEHSNQLPSLSEFVLTINDEDIPVESMQAIDFTQIPNLMDALISVLPANTSFYSGKDFAPVYHKALKKIAREAERALLQPPTDSPVFYVSDKPKLNISSNGPLMLNGIKGVKILSTLLDKLPQVAPQALLALQPELATLHTLRLTALHLLSKGAVVAQIFERNKTDIGLLWLPALLDPSVKALMSALAATLPASANILTIEQQSITPLQQVVTLCSLMLSDLIWREGWNSDSSSAVNQLFFIDGKARFNGVGEGQIPGSILQWLSRFHLGQRDYAPVLWLSEGDKADFELSLGIRSKSAETTPLALSTILTDADWQARRFSILQSVSLLADFFPPINDYLKSHASQPISISSDALPQLLQETLPIIRLLGIRAILPKALEKILRPKLSMKVTGTPTDSGGFLSMADLFAFNWTVAIGEHQLSFDEFEQLVQSASGVIRFKGEYVFLDPAEIAKLQAQLAKPPKVSGAELARVALAGEYLGAGVALDQAAQSLLKQLIDTGESALPDEIHATLRPYQQRGYDWLYRNAQLGLGSVIADDMGLGKTLQVITALLKLKQDGALQTDKALIVVPTSLLTNWQKEIARFAPDLSVDIYHGSKRSLDASRPDILLTTYGVVRSAATEIKALGWRMLVIDEAQNIKNPAAAQTKAVKSIAAKSFVAISGTPVENRLSEYWSIMDFANRGYLGTLPHFIKEYATPIQTHRDMQVASRFKKVTAPFLLRRLKSDKTIISDLPDKIEQDQFCELSPSQTALYESVVREGLAAISGESEAFKKQGLVLQMILALKQICNHPAQYLKKGDDAFELSGKGQRFLELLDDIYANHEKVLIFTQYREMGEILARWIAQRFGQAPAFLHGGVSRPKRDEMVDTFQNDRTERALILSLKAGGTGLNLTAASNVIHFDLWWNPAVEAQATDRAYRIGQHSNVQVHRLITRATFEEKINDMIKAKKDLADLAVGTGETWIGNLSGEELKAVFAL
jgi:uncharacterized Zn finger protein